MPTTTSGTLATPFATFTATSRAPLENPSLKPCHAAPATLSGLNFGFCDSMNRDMSRCATNIGSPPSTSNARIGCAFGRSAMKRSRSVSRTRIG